MEIKFKVRLKDSLTNEERDIFYICSYDAVYRQYFPEINHEEEIDKIKKLPIGCTVFNHIDISYFDGICFMWEEGNLSCDCNRYAYFYDTREYNHPCGDERFELIDITLDEIKAD